MKKQSKVYRCYSVPQKDYLLRNGFEYLDVLIGEDKKTFWVFLKNKQLDKLLTFWSNNNPNNKG